MKRNKKGQFIYTNGKGRYKRKIVNGSNIQYSRYVWAKHNGEILKGILIHHIDGNKMNNNIKNLQMMTSKEHNLLHAKDRKVWNKGLTIKTNDKLKNIIDKAQVNRMETMKKRFIETYKLRMSGLKLQQIADILKISRRQVSERLKRFKELNTKEEKFLKYLNN